MVFSLSYSWCLMCLKTLFASVCERGLHTKTVFLLTDQVLGRGIALGKRARRQINVQFEALDGDFC